MKPYWESLPSFTGKEVALWNWFCAMASGEPDWQGWLAKVLGRLVERPAGLQLSLVQTHQVDTQFGEKVLEFGSKQELFIGRDADNDVVLSANAIAKRHIRLTIKDDVPYLEDLGSRLGTYLGDKKLAPNDPRPLRHGDQFTVFPYRFRVVLAQSWEPETDVRLSRLNLQAMNRAEFFQQSPVAWRVFVIQAHPGGEQALLEASPSFLVRLQKRMLGPMDLDGAKGPVPSDDALLGFTVLAALEHLNQTLKFPFQFSLGRGTRQALADSTRGLLLCFTAGVGEITGDLRVFLSLDLLTRARSGAEGKGDIQYPPGLVWKLPISAGYVDLSADEMAQVGLGDVLLMQRSGSVLLPGCGGEWMFVPEDSNSGQFRIDKYLERSAFVESGELSVSTSRPNLEALPLRLHVVVGEKEFTLAEIQALSPGAILEFETTKSDPVRLIVNGKVLGDGEMVEVDGKLGVKIVRWRSS
ncbi:MAG TPA: FliM/FliN family flagellar motor switch protein [Terriglobales bacterium]|nr:FliM/FliN family flagellar motor switch protein [Terriglobales bacterium]